MAEGMLLSSLLRERKITAHVNANCEGACVLAYLGAPVRSANQASKIGFQCTPIGHKCRNLAVLRQSFPSLGKAKVAWDRLAAFSKSESESLPQMSELQIAKLVHFVSDHPINIEYDQVFVDPDNGNEYTFDEIDWSKQPGIPESERQTVEESGLQSMPAKSGGK